MPTLSPALGRKNKTHVQLENKYSSLDMSRVAAIILGGGEGTRLFPLTMTQCKPAVPFGGKYSLVDIPISNAIHAGCFKTFVITQYLSASLHQHIFNTYNSGNIELLSAEQRPTRKTWYEGSADSVRQNLHYLSEVPVEYFLILAGDQLYKMDFRLMLARAIESDADLVVASLPVNEQDAKRMGVMRLNEDNFVVEFQEKPQLEVAIEHFRMPEFTLRQFKSETLLSHLGSMGIYLFKRDVLFNLISNSKGDDFGKHIIPAKVLQGRVAAYLHEGYWEDIGTIDSYFKANIAMTAKNPLFNCYGDNCPIFSQRLHLPPPKIMGTYLDQAIVCEGAIVEASSVTRSIVGPRTVINKESIITDSYLIGNDYYTTPFEPNKGISIGEGCIIDHAILEKNVSLGNNVKLINKKRLSHYNSDQVYIRDGIIIVTRGAHLPDGYTL